MRTPYSRTMFDLLCEQAARSPDGEVAVSREERSSYAHLEARARAVAEGLRRLGLGRGDRIGILSDNRVAWLEICFGVAALGAVLVPFSTWSTPSELDFLIEDSQVSAIFAIEQFGERCFADDLASLRQSGEHSRLKTLVLIGGAERSDFLSYGVFCGPAARGELPPGELASASDTFVLLYTSGSSNRPKSVPLAHYAAIENGFNIGERQGYTRGERVLISIPLFWSYGAVNALPAILSHGGTLVLQSHFEAGGALDLIERERCTALYTLPAMTNALVAHPTFQPVRTASLRTGVTIGAPQDIYKAAEVLGAAQICNIYGATENYGNCCVTPHHWPLEQRAACQGPPLPGVTLRVTDPETRRELPSGEIGEIEVKGYLTTGYTGNSAQFNADVFTRDGFFRSGDLGALGEDGALRYAGRRSEMIKRAGINVSPAEVEEALQQHECVALAGVTGVDDEARGEIIAAYLIAKSGRRIDTEAIIAHCRTLLSRYKVPDRVIVCEALPLTPTGKLMRRELRSMASADLKA